MATPLYSTSGSEIAFWVVAGAFVLGEWTTRIRSALRRTGTRVERWSLLVVVGSLAAGVVPAILFAQGRVAEVTTGRWPVYGAGIALMALGVAIRWWSIGTLGKFFTVDVQVHDDQVVVDRGPYRWVRHPSYTGLLVFFVGFGLALTNWASLAFLAVFPLLGLLVRIRSEEAALCAALGEPYEQYAATHARLLPRIW